MTLFTAPFGTLIDRCGVSPPQRGRSYGHTRRLFCLAISVTSFK